MDANKEKVKEITKEVTELWKQSRTKYVVPEDQELPPFDRKREMVMCSLLIEEMERQNAPHDELMTALQYCGIVVDADKYRLNAYQAYEDLGIDDICAKYIKKEN